MAYLEADFTSDFKSYLKKLPKNHVLKTNAAFEFKLKHVGKRLNFKHDFQPQQLPYLWQTYTDCVYKKLSDMDPGLKPYDAMQLCFSPAYVVICWYEPRKHKAVYILHIKDIWPLAEKGIKSISEEEAISLAIYSFNL